MNLFSLFVELDMDTTNFDSKAGGVLSTLTTLGDQLGGSKSSSVSAKTIAWGNLLSTTAAKVGQMVVSAGKSVAETGIEYEKRMSAVQATAEATDEEMAALDETARLMGAKTKFSATEAADALLYMAQAGWGAEEMIAGIPGVMDLAAASGEGLGRTSDIVTDVLTALGEEADQAGRFADVLAMAAAKTNTDVGKLGYSFKYVAPTAGALGYEIEDLAIALGLMANAGVKAGTAGTSLRAFLGNLAKPTGIVMAQMNELGLSLTDSTGRTLSLLELMLETREKFNGLSEEEKELATSALFGEEALASLSDAEKAMLALSYTGDETFEGLSEAEKAGAAAALAWKEGMSGLLAIVNASDKDFKELTESIYNSDGAAEDMATIMMDNVAGSLEETSGALETLGLNLFDLVKEPFQSVVDDATAGVNALNSALVTGDTGGLGRWLDTISEKGAQGLEDGVNGAIGAFNKLFETDVEEIPWLSEATLSSLGNLSLFLTDAANASQLLVQSVVTFTEEHPFIVDAIGAMGAAFLAVKNPLGLVAAAVWLIVTNWESVKTAAGGAWQATKDFLGSTYENKVKPIVDALVEGFQTLWDWITAAGNAFADFFGIKLDPSITGGTPYDPVAPTVSGGLGDYSQGWNEGYTTGEEVYGPVQQGVTVVQNIYAQEQSAADLMQEARWQYESLRLGGGGKIVQASVFDKL